MYVKFCQKFFLHLLRNVLSCFSYVWFFVTLWSVVHQDPLSMEFSRQEHWNVLPCPPPGDLPDPGIRPSYSLSPALANMFFTTEVKSLSHVWLFANPWTVAYQAPQSLEFSRQEYWSGLPFSSPGDLPNPGIEPGSLELQVDALPSEPPGKPLFTTSST